MDEWAIDLWAIVLALSTAQGASKVQPPMAVAPATMSMPVGADRLAVR